MFEKSIEQWEKEGSRFTVEEIRQQPAVWKKTYALLQQQRQTVSEFVGKVTSQAEYMIVLTGAGSSEFVGNAAEVALAPIYRHRVHSYATTQIVPCPEAYFTKGLPTLLVSFARSGNSPESVAAVEAAQRVNPNIYHLVITCNRNGVLAKTAQTQDNCLSILLPDETNDRSFAMTSSFSSMYLAVLCALLPDLAEADILHLCAATETILKHSVYRQIVNDFPYQRITYLGGAALKGIAQESALKTLELTAGKICALHESPMGFRHGPKSIVDDETLTVLFLSDCEHSRRYELDLLKEMSLHKNGNRLFTIVNRPCEQAEQYSDWYLCCSAKQSFDNALLGLLYLPVAQLLALLRASSLHISTDNPCPTGEVNRVVQGVTIYR